MKRRTFLSSLAATAIMSVAGALATFASLPKMKITRVRAYLPPNPNPLFNQSDVVVTIETDAGITGIGEGGAKDTLSQSAGRLIGRDPQHIEQLWQDMNRAFFYPAGREKTDAIGACNQIEDLAPFFVEDPVRTEAFLQDLPILRRKVNVPLAAGEEWGNRWDFNTLVEDHDIDFVRATLPNVGGITEIMKIAAICETHFVGIAPHFTGPIATAALVNSLGTFSAPVLMEYNYEGRTLPHLTLCLDFKNGKLYPNERPGLGVELDFKQLTKIAEITEPVTARAQTYFRPDGSITNW